MMYKIKARKVLKSGRQAIYKKKHRKPQYDLCAIIAPECTNPYTYLLKNLLLLMLLYIP